MSSKFSFGFNKKQSIEPRADVPKNDISSIFFESKLTAADESSRSVITSLGLSGFEGTLLHGGGESSLKPIPCSALLPEPRRSKRGSRTEIVPKKDKRSGGHTLSGADNELSDKATKLDSKRPTNVERYGLVSNENEDAEDNDLGPPTKTPATERNVEQQLLAEGHRGVTVSRTTRQRDADKESVANYEDVPVENFGLALLLGMGYNSEDATRSKLIEPKLRVYSKGGLGTDKMFQELSKEKKVGKKEMEK